MARTKPYFTLLSDVAKQYGLNESELFIEYCKMKGVYKAEDMSRVWQRYDGRILLTDAEINKLVIITTVN
jgi:hypothetical protein